MAVRATLPRAAASGAAMTEPTSFARMLASSRLATHSPTVPQVYTSPAAHIARGDFGLKQALPSRNKPLGSLRYVDVNAVDTREGQVAWNEREHEVMIARRFREMNVGLNLESPIMSSAVTGRARGSHGPRISTTYDPSTLRSVPTTYDRISDKGLRDHLQNEARLGRGPAYHGSIYDGEAIAEGLDRDGPFGQKSDLFTHAIDIPTDFQSMDEKTFERYVQNVRRQRSKFRRFYAERALSASRAQLIERFNEERNKLEGASNEARKEEQATALADVPPLMTVSSLPLPKESEIISEDANATDKICADLWDESRGEEHALGSWRAWLRRRNGERASEAEDTTLPHATALPAASQPNASLHPRGGLQYGQPDAIQVQLFSEGLSGRQLDRPPEPRRGNYHSRSSQGHYVAVGGLIAYMPATSMASSIKPTIDWSQRRPEQGVVNVTPNSAVRQWTTAQTGEPTRPITPWGGKTAKEMSKTTSASSLVAHTAEGDADHFDSSDSFAKDALPPQYGPILLSVHDSAGGSGRNLARGRPGSAEWISSIDESLGYRSGSREEAPLDVTTLQSHSRFPDVSVDGARRLGKGMYSPREQQRAESFKSRKEARNSAAAAAAAATATT